MRLSWKLSWRDHFAQKYWIREARKEGARVKTIEIAKNLINQHVDAEIISNVTGLSLEKIIELMEKQN